jgi:hypothetical protein
MKNRNVIGQPAMPPLRTGAARTDVFREGDFGAVERPGHAVIERNSPAVEEAVIGQGAAERAERADSTERLADWALRTEVAVRDLGGMHKGAATRHWTDYDADFRTNFSACYGESGRYEDAMPAYRYGYDLATSEDYYGRDWTAFELDARDRWELHNPGTWERVKESIRYAWAKVTGRA